MSTNGERCRSASAPTTSASSCASSSPRALPDAMRAARPRPSVRALFPSLAIALVAILPAAAHAACDLAHFGDRAPRTCPRSSAECLPPHLPEPVKEIVRGAVVEWVGLAANDGRASWRAL